MHSLLLLNYLVVLTPSTTFINIIFHEAETVYSSCMYLLYIGDAEGGLVSQAKNLASLEAFCIFTDVGLLDNIMWQWCGNVLKTKLLIIIC